MKINFMHFYNFDDITFLSKLLKNKLDIINISLTHIDDYIIKSKIFSCLIFHYCFFILSIQKLNGSTNLVIPLFNDKLIYDIIYIFCKYYNNIELKINLCKSTMTNSFLLFLSEFKGINESELKELLDMSILINSKIKNTGIHINFLDENKRNELNIIKPITENSSNLTISNIHNNNITELYLDSLNTFVKYKYKLYNTEVKLIKRISKILEEINNSEFIKKNHQIDDLIFRKQFEFLSLFYTKIFSVKYT